MKPDITYLPSGMFVRFFPETPEGREAWDTMADENGVAAVLKPQSKSVISQLRAAGYRVSKAKPVSDGELADILSELSE